MLIEHLLLSRTPFSALGPLQGPRQTGAPGGHDLGDGAGN